MLNILKILIKIFGLSWKLYKNRFPPSPPKMPVKKANMASTPVKSSFLGFFLFKIVLVKNELTFG